MSLQVAFDQADHVGMQGGVVVGAVVVDDAAVVVLSAHMNVPFEFTRFAPGQHEGRGKEQVLLAHLSPSCDDGPLNFGVHH